MKVGIIGAGIGGLTAALSLLRQGIEVQVFEQASRLTEAGAGVQISPNASRVLHGLGLAGDLATFGVQPIAWHQRRWFDGRTLLRTPLAGLMERAFGFPHHQIHRADLIDMLARHIPGTHLHTAHRLVAIRDHAGGVEADFQNGRSERFDALVGADGIHSEVRRHLFGSDGARFAGCVAYRGLVPASHLRHLNLEVTAQVWMGPHAHFVHYFVRRCEAVNFVAVVDRQQWSGESWTQLGDKAEALDAFREWHPQVREILSAVGQVHEWALFDRPPMARWSVGRTTLLGDACHPMMPFMAQGAAQAIEDGATLASCLAQTDGVEPALLRYEALRRERTTRVQALSAANKARFHLPDGAEQRARDSAMQTGGTDWAPRAIAWLYGHDATRTDLPAPDQRPTP